MIQMDGLLNDMALLSSGPVADSVQLSALLINYFVENSAKYHKYVITKLY